MMDKKKYTTIHIPRDMKHHLQGIAKYHRRSMTQQLQILLEPVIEKEIQSAMQKIHKVHKAGDEDLAREMAVRLGMNKE